MIVNEFLWVVFLRVLFRFGVGVLFFIFVEFFIKVEFMDCLWFGLYELIEV